MINIQHRGGRMRQALILFILLIMMPNALVTQTLPLQTSIETEKSPPQKTSQVDYYAHLIEDVSPIKDAQEVKDLAQAIHHCGIEYNVDPLILLAIIRTQSNFRKKIVGPGNCVGYYQINLNVHKVSRNFLDDTHQQTKKATQIYVWFRGRHKGNRLKALNAYNGRVLNNSYCNKVLSHYNKYKVIIQAYG